MSAKPLPSQEVLHNLLDYDPSTGAFRFRVRGNGRIDTQFAGRPALCTLKRTGYLHGAVGGATYSAHRIAWKYVHGTDPVGEIDHINGDKTDNRIANLRDVSRAINGRNVRLLPNNSSGTPGVHWHKKRAEWRATIKADGKHHCLGTFARKGDAIAARKAAEVKFGFHPNHGRSA